LTETPIAREILDYLQYRGIFCWRQNTGRRGGVQFGYVGSGDITGILPDGRRLEVEVKRPGGGRRPGQVVFGLRIQENCGVYIRAESVEDVERQLREMR